MSENLPSGDSVTLIERAQQACDYLDVDTDAGLQRQEVAEIRACLAVLDPRESDRQSSGLAERDSR